MADYTLNKTGAQIDAIGDIVTNTGTLTNIADSTWTDLATVTLSKGVWVLVGQMRLTSDGINFPCQVSIGTISGSYAVGTGGWAQFYSIQGLAQTAMTVSRIVNVTTSSQIFYLTGWQKSGATRALNSTGNILTAVRIA